MSTTAAFRVKRSTRRAWPPLLHRLVRTVRSRGLFEPGHHILAAVSGGPDSVALLSLLHHLAPFWRLTLTVAHINYGLRGEESEGDEQFVVDLCRRLDVPLVTRRADVRTGDRSGSVQAAAREVRYRALREIAGKVHADRIALGHTADDQAETVLLWLLRGAGLTGLAGMPAVRDGVIVRPLYDCTRSEVLTYLTQAGREFREDSTNGRPIYARNRIRHEVLPVITRVAPGAVAALCRSAELCREDDRFLDAHLALLCEGSLRREPDGSWVVAREFVRQLPLALQRRVIRELFRRGDLSGRAPSVRVVDEALHAVMACGHRQSVRTSARFQVTEQVVRCLPSGHMVGGTADRWAPMPLPVPSRIRWPGTGQTIAVERLSLNGQSRPTSGPLRVLVDAGRVSQPLVVRSWQAGDRFQPLGMKSRSKKLQDYFVDLKVPMTARRRIPVVASPEGIVWIVGYRQDERWAATAETRACLVLSASEESNGEGAS